MIDSLLSSLKKSLLHLFYPSRCIHCRCLLNPDARILCELCSELLEPIDPSERCPGCFCPLPENTSEKCTECMHDPSPFYRTGSVFEYNGPAASLVKKLKYGNRPYLAGGMGAFLFAQFNRLNWSVPDACVPVPLSRMHRFERGYNQSELLARELGRYLDCPFRNLLKRKSGDFSQAVLSGDARKSLDSTSFRPVSRNLIEGKTLLLIDDVSTTGSTLRRCGEVLAENGAGLLYALTFCRTSTTPSEIDNEAS